MTDRPPRTTTPGTQRLTAWFAFGLYAAMTLALTWPLALHMGDATPTFWGDARTTVWILDWDAHVLARDPTDLFQAPVFYPETDALAYSEPNLTLAVPASPIIWLTGNPYLAHNLLFLLAFPLSGLAAFLLVRELLADPSAALVAGGAFGFAPYWFGHIIGSALVKLLLAGWLPLAALAMVRWLRRGQSRWLVLATGTFVLACLQSWYVGVVTGVVLVLTAAVVLVWGQGKVTVRKVVNGVLAAAVAAGLLLPYAAPYLRVRQRDPMQERSLELQEVRSARASSYLSAPPENTLYGNATRRWQTEQSSPESNLFPGLAISTLAVVGAWMIGRRGSRFPAAIGIAMTIAGVLLSLGGGTRGAERLLPWSWLHAWLPIFRSLGAPARAHILTIFGLSVLAGVGAQRVLEGTRRKVLIAFLVVLTFGAEAAALPRRLGPAPKTERIYSAIAGRLGGVLELPMITYEPRTDTAGVYSDSYDTLLRATAHWRPIANGIPAIFPRSYSELSAALLGFPDAASMALLRERRIRTLIVRTNDLHGSPWEGLSEKLESAPGIRLLFHEQGVNVYDIAPA